MNIITVNASNIEQEHICCAISDKKGENCVGSKKAWLKDRFEEGLVFKKLDARGKVFIEYIPAEYAWVPITAPDYLYINCFWVSGKYKGQGLANRLLQECIDDARAKGKNGLVILSSRTKKPFLSDPKYLRYKGFRVADTAVPYYELLYFPLVDDAPIPSFRECVKTGEIDENGIVIYYTNQCPHTEKYVGLVQQIAHNRHVPFQAVKITSREQAQAAPAPFTTYSLFHRGTFMTNEIYSEKKFAKFLDEQGYA